ncbi:hypothetical protein D3C87_1922190 [compost metagenome]
MELSFSRTSRITSIICWAISVACCVAESCTLDSASSSAFFASCSAALRSWLALTMVPMPLAMPDTPAARSE